ncbi:MAG: arginyl-tRNA synthetase [candidate division Zixibacteria bacterium SM23_73_3]|nr:MAG: arginyl-tRNA synthetase [candidate division Zixibacteria bacterium SM23_73_3]
MNKFIEEIVKIISREIDLPKEEIKALVEIPPDQKLGDYAFPCFVLGKRLKKSPNQIAGELALRMKVTGLIQEIYSIGPYVNFKVDKNKLAEFVLSQIFDQKDNYGSDNAGKGKTIVVDFSSPNIAKPFGIGHLRTTVIGNSLYHIFKKLGFNVVRINHLGDWGTQFGKVILAYKMWGDENELLKDPLSTLYDLYVRFHQEVEKKPQLEEEARAWFKRLEEGDKEATELWKKFRDYSLEEFNRVYQMLGIEFDSYAGESLYNQFMDQTIEEIKAKGLAEMSQDALIVKLEKYDLPPCLLKKKDEATLYATRDIAAAIYRYNTYHFHKSLYVVGSAQKLHFQQVFGVLELMRYKWAKDCVHVDFGWIKLRQEMMSTRKGNIILLEDVLNKSIQLAGKIIEEKNPKLENKEEVAKDVGIGAVLFADLSTRRNKDIDFDWDQVLSFEGETAPYAQYTHARLCSLLRKYGKSIHQEIDFGVLSTGEESTIIKLLEDFPRKVKASAESYEPAFICSFLVNLCSIFNRFYQKQRIITEDEKSTKARMLLIKAIQLTLKSGLSLLGIRAPERM